MRLTIPQTGIILAGSGLLAVTLFVVTVMGSPLLALAVPVGLVVVGAVVLFPFLGLVLIALFSQLDALANILFQELPISGVKVLAFLTLAGLIVNSYRVPRRERLGPDHPVLRLAALFGVVVLISFLFVESVDFGLLSVRRLWSMILLLYLTIRLTQTRQHVEVLLLCVVASTLVSSLVIIWDWEFGGHLLSSTVAGTTAQWEGISRSAGASDYDPTTAATTLLAGTTLAMMMFLRTERWRLLTGATVLVGTAGIVLSFARSVALVYAIALLWLAFKYRTHRLFPFGCAAGLLLAVAVVPLIPAEYWERLATLQDFSTDVSLSQRLGYHLIGLDLLVQHPLLGVGAGNFRQHYADLAYRWTPGWRLGFRAFHNMYGEVAVEFGLIGLALFVGIFVAAIRGLVKARKASIDPLVRGMAESLLFAYVAFLMASAFVPNQYNKYVWLFTGVAVVLARLGARRENEPVPSPNVG